ncbi:hypothetical protein Gbem_2409 [Citrifermentans bemidjiense Bem]|uniref:Uncharacterized protein n=1 Tax=Citrifermentans bemidjiense (strain ATCC BAA-1014 / DSM 16622 / JCM 12645 / Bem) TaxID=404380 RepID=B5EFV4_CITBB|nr:hypothetical protein [Citrifermentans bemidjiense]ACH39419.1 hypothetical protein Gbem_2409 [Citrifermentans bemidjiense Bem]
METQPATKRLCSEIQLFDLCDLDTCTCKDGRYCTNPAILERFEAIKEEDERTHYVAEEYEEEDEDAEDLDGHDDDYEEDE